MRCVRVCVSRLVDCLRDLGAADWQLAGQACQAMWNLTGGGSEELLDTEDRQTLLKILTEFLGVCSYPDIKEGHRLSQQEKHI